MPSACPALVAGRARRQKRYSRVARAQRQTMYGGYGNRANMPGGTRQGIIFDCSEALTASGVTTKMSEDTSRTQRPDPAAVDPRLGAVRADKDALDATGRFKGKRRRKVSYLTTNKIEFVDYKEVNILRRFINDRGKILPSRQSGNTAKQQRMIASAIRKAREMALLPFVVTEMSAERREYAPRRERSYRRDEPAPTPPVEQAQAE
jgi:small subunit ribosomal protein S18